MAGSPLSRMRVTAFHQGPLTHWNHTLGLLGQVSAFRGLTLGMESQSLRRTRNTILRSPHVHKKARDQVEVQHRSHVFALRSNYNWLRFFHTLLRENVLPLELDYTPVHSQKVYYLPPCPPKV